MSTMREMSTYGWYGLRGGSGDGDGGFFLSATASAPAAMRTATTSVIAYPYFVHFTPVLLAVLVVDKTARDSRTSNVYE